MTRAAATLTVPPDEDYANLVGAFARDAAARAAVDDERAARLVEAVDIGFRAIVRDAMADSREPLRISAVAAARELRIAIDERGLPLDAASAQRDPRVSQLSALVDRVRWHARARRGSELQLCVACEPPVRTSDESDEGADEAAAFAPESYATRRFEPADAEGVVRCFYQTYGYAYVNDSAYEPRRLVALNRDGRYLSFVAIAPDGEIAAHYALDREPGAPSAEGCGAIVAPRHRGKRLLQRLRAEAEEYAKELRLEGFFSEPVTDHGATQHESERFGARITSIALGHSPRAMLAKHMELSATGQRQSLTLYAKTLRAPVERRAALPTHHRAVLRAAYERLGIPLSAAAAARRSPYGEIRTTVSRSARYADVAVLQIGDDSTAAVLQAVRDARALGSVDVIYALLPLDDPRCEELCIALEDEGMFYSGLVAWGLDGRDALRLQMPLTPIDCDALTMASDEGRTLLAYIVAERERVAALGRRGAVGR